jgi:hypothetical protein
MTDKETGNGLCREEDKFGVAWPRGQRTARGRMLPPPDRTSQVRCSYVGHLTCVGAKVNLSYSAACVPLVR